ncbi:MAG: triose-phosphate isomerase [Deltaproteobacteria bacterium]|nr:triose-phosphate isomerase [Deltaproteobacteria bacterium]
MARTPFLAGNWKMFKTGGEAAEFVEQFKPAVAGLTGRQVALAVPATALERTAAAAKGTGIIIGAQNLHWEKEGAFTGEISVGMIKEAGGSMAIIGHSERRTYFAETDEVVAKKVAAALSGGLLAVLCLGENLAQRESGEWEAFLAGQLKGSLAAVGGLNLTNLIVAYEPIWAIGTGKTATADEAEKTQAHVRKELASLLGDAVASATRILYGGSVKPDNAASLMAQPNIDGVLVGGASLKADSFSGIVKY